MKSIRQNQSCKNMSTFHFNLIIKLNDIIDDNFEYNHVTISVFLFYENFFMINLYSKGPVSFVARFFHHLNPDFRMISVET